jgi:hypothetical protein
MAKGFDLELDFRVKSIRWHWRLWRMEPEVPAEPQRRGDIYASTERADTWHEPERRMGFTANTPN